MTLFFLTMGGGMLLFVVFFAYRMGKRTNELDQKDLTLKNISTINDFNKAEDEEVDRQIANAGDNPVRGPWIRMRK